jgi:AcrR family transcriptional regulator
MMMTAAAVRAERRRDVVRAELVGVAWGLANEMGVAGVSLKNVAERMEIRPPSLYQYVPNLHGLFDLMFRAGWTELGAVIGRIDPKVVSAHETYQALIDFCLASPARFQLMFQRPVPGFEPSAAAFGTSEQVYDAMKRLTIEYGITRQADVDLVDSMLLGLVGNQIANDPGGSRYVSLAADALDRLVPTLRKVRR